jgi:NitT/TauT family transport system substrate-binding protein
MWKKNSCVLTLIIVLSLGLFFMVQNRQDTESKAVQEKASLRIGYRSHVFYAPLFVALENGYFNDHNIDVNAIEFESTNQMIESMLANRIDASLGGVNTFVLFQLEEKSPGALKIFSIANETSQNPLSHLLVKKDTGVKDITLLYGKTIGTFLGSNVQALYGRIIQNNNLQDTSISQMPHRLQLQALESGEVDAIVTLEPTATIGGQKNISTVLEAGLFDTYFLKDMPLATSVVRSNLVLENSFLVQSLVDVAVQSFEFIDASPSETRNIIAKYTSLTEDIANHVALPQFHLATEQDIQKLNDLKSVFVKLNEIVGSADVSNMVLEIQ